MKLLVVGSGGREHALAWKLGQSPLVTKIYCAPGNAGTARLGENLPIGADDTAALLDFAKSQDVHLTVIGPEAPLVAGVVDAFRSARLPVVGPARGAAQLEGSKVFAKDFMRRHGIPTAAYQVYSDAESALRDLDSAAYSFPVVIKADGLAAGKGVFVCQDLDQSRNAISAIMHERQFGSAGDQVVIEEFLQGEEASFMVFSDGRNVLPMPPSQDHKAIYDGDRGPNTGGMGAYSIDSILSPAQLETALERIVKPVIEAMAAEGNPYTGILYAGLMLTAEGPKVLEFNVRFGDPETQVILPRLDSDLVEILQAVAAGDIGGIRPVWSPDPVVSIVLASGGYPGPYQKGKQIHGLEMAGEDPNTVVFHAGTETRDGKVLTNGGRVLAMTARARSLDEAILRAYEGVNKVRFEGMYYRHDIGAKALRKKGAMS